MKIKYVGSFLRDKAGLEDVSWVQDFPTYPRWIPYICPGGGQMVWVPSRVGKLCPLNMRGAGRVTEYAAEGRKPSSPLTQLRGCPSCPRGLCALMQEQKQSALWFLPANRAHILRENVSREEGRSTPFINHLVGF